MTPKDGYHQREENPHQGPSHSFGVPEEDRDPADRERSIEKGRDRSGAAGAPSRTSESARPQEAVRGQGVGLSPFSLMRRMAEDMDRMFHDFGLARRGLGMIPAFGIVDRELARGRPGMEAVAWSPQVETFRRGTEFIVRADLPGLKKEDVNVEVQENVLAISGERRSESQNERDDSFRSERSYGRFFRAFTLPEDVDASQCDASFKEGVLEVSFARRPAAEKRSTKVPIR